MRNVIFTVKCAYVHWVDCIDTIADTTQDINYTENCVSSMI